MKKMNRAIEYPIYPTAEQASLIQRTFGCVRYIWNQMLADHNEFKAATDIDFTPTPAKYKKDAPFLKEVDSLALANTQLALNKAFSKFYNEKNIGYPNFKSKKRDKKSYTTNNQIPKGGGPTIYIGDGFIHLPKVGNIPANLYRLPQSDWRLKNATVKQTKTGRYFCVLTFEFEIDIQEVQPSVKRGIGLDYSSPLFYVDSEGRSPEFPKPFRTAEAKLANEQHKLSRMKRGSKNYNKQLLKVQKLHEHIANQRKDFLHKLSNIILFGSAGRYRRCSTIGLPLVGCKWTSKDMTSITDSDMISGSHSSHHSCVKRASGTPQRNTSVGSKRSCLS